jgi:hypothetical protein
MQAICIELNQFGDKPGNGLPLDHPLETAPADRPMREL